MNIEEVGARHQEFEGWCVTCMQGEDAGSVPWPCDAAVLLAELKGAREKLEAARPLVVRIPHQTPGYLHKPRHDQYLGCQSGCLRCAFDRTLKGGE